MLMILPPESQQTVLTDIHLPLFLAILNYQYSLTMVVYHTSQDLSRDNPATQKLLAFVENYGLAGSNSSLGLDKNRPVSF